MQLPNTSTNLDLNHRRKSNMNYIDADKMIAEIERQQRRLMVLSNTEQVDMRRDCALQMGVYDSILVLINSLQQEQSKVDLEKEIKEVQRNYKTIEEYEGYPCTMYADGIEWIAKHFYELGINSQEEK